ncbi:MAG: recombinase family protein [Aquabacterium sp.]|uniref:recombinase family protein n=1 Tax=Aquabacterium sp. TaxID=1872578 RepID=UPI00271E7A0A|nr:recombinase family protein [Aquabacterium sp.]MDO9004588.1 recombinase family protein [Aquabacterium sp.]
MTKQKFISYYRVSTTKQGQSGLGLEAQQAAVFSFLSQRNAELAGEFREVETGKGAEPLAKRPQLRAALNACRKNNATLIIAKLDRLARNVHFVSGLMESQVRFIACDMPEANELTIHIMAAFAEHEAKRISQRTKEALAIAKARGVQLGSAGPKNLRPNIEQRRQEAIIFANKLRPLFNGMNARGLSQRAMAKELNDLNVPTPKGGIWRISQIQRIFHKIT